MATSQVSHFTRVWLSGQYLRWERGDGRQARSQLNCESGSRLFNSRVI